MRSHATLSFFALLLIIGTASASPFPGSSTLENISGGLSANQAATSPIYSVERIVCPVEIWLLLAIAGLAFLGASILYPQRGELITALIALGFNTVAWILSSFIGFYDTASHVVGDVLVIQPIYTIYAPESLPWLWLVIFVISVGNVILAMGNFFIQASKPKPLQSTDPGELT